MLQHANSVGVPEIWTQSLIFTQQVLHPLSPSRSPRLGLMKFISDTICLITLCCPTTLRCPEGICGLSLPECQWLCGRCHNYFHSPMLGSPFLQLFFFASLGFSEHQALISLGPQRWLSQESVALAAHAWGPKSEPMQSQPQKSWMKWHMPVILLLGKSRQRTLKFTGHSG